MYLDDPEVQKLSIQQKILWKLKQLLKSKTEEKLHKDAEEVERRKKLCQERTPMELGNIGSLSELPIPAPIQNLFSKSDADKPEKPQRKNMEEKRK